MGIEYNYRNTQGQSIVKYLILCDWLGICTRIAFYAVPNSSFKHRSKTIMLQKIRMGFCVCVHTDTHTYTHSKGAGEILETDRTGF